ncbi:MAG: hypothetical protein Q9195_007332 [Heterodermia aff. obscurata]
MTNSAFIAVFVLLVIVIVVVIIATATLLKRRKRRNSKPKDAESANIGNEHVEFANHLNLHNMQTTHPQTARTAPRPSMDQWRRRGIELSTFPRASIPEEVHTGQASQNSRQSHGSSTPIADSFIRRSRIGIAKTTPYEETPKQTSRPKLTLDTHQAVTSPYATHNPKPSVSVETPQSRHVKFEDPVARPSMSSTRNSKFQEHVQSPDQWHNVELSPPRPRQSMQSNSSSCRSSFESNLSGRLPESWGKPIASKRFPLD